MTCACPPGRSITDPARHAEWHTLIAEQGVGGTASLDDMRAARGIATPRLEAHGKPIVLNRHTDLWTALRWLAATRPTFTADDLTTEVEHADPETARDVLNEAEGRGLIARTPNGYRTTVRPQTLADARDKRDRAMAQAEQGSDAEWQAQARVVIAGLCAARESWTTDDVWDSLAARGVPAPREPRALGPIIAALVRAKKITDTGGWVQSRRRHAARIPLYTGA